MELDIGAKEGQFMKKKIIYTNKPIQIGKIIKNFFPKLILSTADSLSPFLDVGFYE